MHPIVDFLRARSQALQALNRAIAITCIAALCALAPLQRAQAGTTTLGIVLSTAQALPSCLQYDVKGVCIFMSCSILPPRCWFSSSIRIGHRAPDVIVSTYNDSSQHPWTDIGAPLANAMGSVGAAMSGSVLDASANNDRTNKEEMTFKSVDVIGHPMGMLSDIVAGNVAPLPSSFGLPTYSNMANFPSQELPNIQAQWQSMPANTGNYVLDMARQVALAASQASGAVGQLANLPSQLGSMNSALGNLQNVLSSPLSASTLGTNVGQIPGLDINALLAGPIAQVKQAMQMAQAGSHVFDLTLVCPSSGVPFSLYYLSDLDALSWRGLIPVEALYPGSWIPGSSDVSDGNPFIYTWGGRYPRTGEISQPNPVKASAVIAERAIHIIKRGAQPHIYQVLAQRDTSGMVMFASQASPVWQMVYPQDTGCITFGGNDSLSLGSFGDGQSSSEYGFIWNLWHYYECCTQAGMWLWQTIP